MLMFIMFILSYNTIISFTKQISPRKDQYCDDIHQQNDDNEK